MLKAAVELISLSEAPTRHGRKDPALRTVNEGESNSQPDKNDLTSAAKSGATLSSQEVAQFLPKPQHSASQPRERALQVSTFLATHINLAGTVLP